MIKNVTLTQVSRFDKDPNGNPYMSQKTGRPYVRMTIKAEEYGDQRLSGFGGAWNASWKPGDEVTIDVKEVEKDGKKYLNFDKADIEAQNLVHINNLLRRMDAVEAWIKRQAKPAPEPIKREDYPEDEFPGDIPF